MDGPIFSFYFIYMYTSGLGLVWSGLVGRYLDNVDALYEDTTEELASSFRIFFCFNSVASLHTNIALQLPPVLSFLLFLVRLDFVSYLFGS